MNAVVDVCAMIQSNPCASLVLSCSLAVTFVTTPVHACGDQGGIIRSRSLNEHGSLYQNNGLPRPKQLGYVEIQQATYSFRTIDGLSSGAQAIAGYLAKQTTTILQQNLSLNHIAWVSRDLPYPGERNERSGCRGSALGDNEDGLRALVPASGYGLTVAEAPTLFFYVPQTTSLPMEFTLLTEQGDVIYQTTFTLPPEAGIVPINLATLTNDVQLEAGHLYYWFFAIVTDQADRSGDHLVSGWVERAERSSTLDPAPASGQQDTPLLYAQSGLWYDTLMAIARLRHDHPTNSEYVAQWTELLESIGFSYLANKPFLQMQPLPESQNVTP